MATVEGIRAGRAYVEVGSDQSQLEKGLKAAEAKVKAFGASVAKIGAGLGALGASITAPLVAAMNKFAESGSALAHMSERTGVSVEALSALGYAAKQSGTDMEGVEIGIRRMQKAMTAGSLENMQAQMTFMKLGLSIKDIMRLNPDEQFDVMAKRIAAIRDPTARAGAAMMIFGKSGTSLLPMIMNMDKLTKEAEQFGLVTSSEAAEGALKLEHSMKLLEAITGKIVGTAGSALVPMFEQWNATLAQIGKRVKDFVAANKPMIVTIANVGFALTAAGTAFVALGAIIAGMGATFGLISSAVGVLVGALALLTTPLGAVAVGFVGMTVAMGKTNEAIAATTKFMKENFGDMFDDAQKTFKGIGDALSAGDITLAAQILMAGLNVEFLKGTQKISALWKDWGVSLIEGFKSVTFDIASGFLELQRVAEISANKIKVAYGKEGALGALSEIAKIVMPASPYDVIARAAGAPDTQDILKGVITGKAPELFKGPGAGEAGINQKALDAQSALRDQQRIEEENRRKSADKQLADAQKAVADAQKELDRLRTNARVLALGPGREPPQIPGAKPEEEPLTPEGLDKAMEDQKAKIDVAGSFQAMTAAGLGAGKSVANEQLKEQKKTNNHLEKVSRQMQNGKLVFQ